MKHLTVGVGILALLLALSLLTVWLTAQFLDRTEQPLRALPLYFDTEDFDTMLSLIGESQEIWESYHGYFCSILSHAELEEVGYCFAALTAYAEQGELAELRDAHTRLLDMLEHLRIMDKPYYYNILTILHPRR